jgi:hypothetical protein
MLVGLHLLVSAKNVTLAKHLLRMGADARCVCPLAPLLLFYNQAIPGAYPWSCHIDPSCGREQVCPAGKQPNDDQSGCVQCPVGQATTTGACAACIAGWIPVSNVAGDEQARCEM